MLHAESTLPLSSVALFLPYLTVAMAWLDRHTPTTTRNTLKGCYNPANGYTLPLNCYFLF